LVVYQLNTNQRKSLIEENQQQAQTHLRKIKKYVKYSCSSELLWKKILFTRNAEVEVFGRLFKQTASLKPLKWLFQSEEESSSIQNMMDELHYYVHNPDKINNVYYFV